MTRLTAEAMARAFGKLVMTPIPSSTSLAAVHPSGVRVLPTANAAKVISIDIAAQATVELFDWARSVAGLGDCTCAVVVSGILDCRVSIRHSGTAMMNGVRVAALMLLYAADGGLAGAEAGSGRGAGAGVIVSNVSFSRASQTRCLCTLRTSWDAEASLVTPALCP
eukprot:979491-Pleurochrysis_carterae.AAC.4